MNSLKGLVRWLSPKWYCRWMLGRCKRERQEKLEGARSLPPKDRQDLVACLDFRIDELSEWLRAMEEADLVRKARKMDVYLEDIPPVPPDEEEGTGHQEAPSHYCMGAFGNELLCWQVREALRKAMRERAPAYRKERREVWDIVLKMALVLIAVIGALTSLIALLKK